MEEPEMPNPLDGLNNQLSKKMSKQERDESEQIAKNMLAKADEAKAERDKELEEKFKDINDPKKQMQVFRTKLWQYNHPKVFVVFGFFFAVIFGLIQPLCGTFFVQIIFAMYKSIFEGNKQLLDAVIIWIYALGGIAVCAFIGKSLTMCCFSYVAQNMIMDVRRDLYLAMLKQDIGWHDDRDHASGSLSAMLASDVETLNGASSEGLSAIAEAQFALLWSVGLGLYFSWPLTIVFLCVLPLMMIGACLQTAQDARGFDLADTMKAADRLAGDAILNYKTIQAFGCNEEILEEYGNLVDIPTAEDVKKGHKHAFLYGFSQVATNLVFTALYLAMAYL